VDTRYLRSFLRTADLRSISRAAESLGIAQPSLSQQLLRLEDEVGFRLFDRSARGVTITEAGRIFQEHARHILRSIDQALVDVQETNAAASGQAIIALPYSINRLIGRQLVEAVIYHAPNTSVRLVEANTGQIRGWLDEGKIDLGMLYDLGPIRHLSARSLASEEMYLIGPPGAFGGRSQDAPNIPLARLRDFPLITAGPQHGLRRFLDQEATRLGFAYRVAYEIDAVATIAALVEHGHGYSVLSKPAVDDLLASGRLDSARLGEGELRRTLALVRNPAKVVTHASARVEDLTIKVMASLIATNRWDADPEAVLRSPERLETRR
jgi:LysR family nitrogen assimilation transcriptional regulator